MPNWYNGLEAVAIEAEAAADSAEAEAATAIKEAFDANDIMIPFPIRTLDFGIRGGEKLNEQLSLNKQNGQSKTENQSKK